MVSETFVTRHPVASYFALTFFISWGGVLMVIGGSGGMSGGTATSDPRFVYALIAMLAGPSISSLLLTTVVRRTERFPSLRARVLAWCLPARWYAAALLTAPLLWLMTQVGLSLVSPQFVPGLVTSSDPLTHVVAGLAVAIAAGIFEELGWTGFAIPCLRRRHGVFATGIIVGVLWGAWHLLVSVFWAGRVTAGDLPLWTFMSVSALSVLFGYLAAFRVLMVWVYERTHSVLLAMLMHASLTGSVLILDPQGLSGTEMLTYSFALAAAVWLAVAAVWTYSGWHRSQPVRQSVQPAA